MMNHKYIAIVVGILMAFAWQYCNAEIIGYLSLWRFPDHWPIWIRIGAPALLFFIVTAVSNAIIIGLFKTAASWAINASMLAYCASVVYGHWEVPNGMAEMILSAALITMAILSGLISLFFIKRKMGS